MATVTLSWDGDDWFVESADGVGAEVSYSIDTPTEGRVTVKVVPIVDDGNTDDK